MSQNIQSKEHFSYNIAADAPPDILIDFCVSDL